ncbi:MAG: molybdopterin-dependent oxidoreductase [Candidatus Thorarchaeota archaeon]
MKLKTCISLSKKTKQFFAISSIIALIGIGLGVSITFLEFKDTSNSKFPDFITKNEDYYITRIDNIPDIDPQTYVLNVWGHIDNPKMFNLTELRALDLVERTLTTECIGNPTKGPLLSTAVWKGFLIYDILESLGLKENATGVRYLAEDGYYVSHTFEQLKDNGTIGALYMNGEILPPAQGFPLRVVNPGSYGAKQPAWVVEMEVIDRALEDYWDDRGWDTSSPMDVDSTIFFPEDYVEVKVGIPLKIGGAAFGGTRISNIEYTIDAGLNWDQAIIVKSIDEDHVWVFWEINLTFNEPGTFYFRSRATDIYNNTQPMDDLTRYDGFNACPQLTVIVID